MQTPENAVLQSSENESRVVRVPIPYFGIVRIARQGVVSREMTNVQPLSSTGKPYAQVFDMHDTESSDDAMCDVSSGHFDEKLVS